ncbi:MAG: hypothetical protein Q4G70_14690 [Pseudomonadota bacterium]|nr:hypothetical protein [Pseudomonadota bacterium]
MTAMGTAAKLRGIWRVNAYLLFIVGVLVVIGLMWILAEAAWSKLRPHGVRNVVATDESVSDEKLAYRLRSARGNFVVLDVVSNQRIDTKFGSKDAYDALRNQVFVQVEDGSTSMLFASNERLITRVWGIKTEDVGASYRSEEGEDEGEPMRARLYEVVLKDSNADARLTERDTKTIMLAQGEGVQLLTLADGIRSVQGVALRKPHELRFVATTDSGESHLYRFDLQNWTPLAPLSLPSLKE